MAKISPQIIQTETGGLRENPLIEGERMESLQFEWGDTEGGEDPPIESMTIRTQDLLACLGDWNVADLYLKRRGRDSVARTIAYRMANDGFVVGEDPGKDSVMVAQWNCQMDLAGDMNAQFPLVQTIYHSLTSQLRDFDKGRKVAVMASASHAYRKVIWAVYTWDN
jgi:hypothetical protein